MRIAIIEGTLPEIREVLQDWRSGVDLIVPLQEAPVQAVQPASVLEAVRTRLGVTPDDLAGDNRTRDTTYARHVAIYLLRRDARLSVSEIGRMLGGRDHATIIGGYKRIAGELKTRPETREDIEIIRGIVARIEAEEQSESA